MLADVPNWRGLAGSLNTKVDDIEENCKTDITPATCFRRSLVRRYCNMQRSENPRKVVEDIAGALEQMDHKLQAEQLRKLQFGKSIVNDYSIRTAYYNISPLSEHRARQKEFLTSTVSTSYKLLSFEAKSQALLLFAV